MALRSLSLSALAAGFALTAFAQTATIDPAQFVAQAASSNLFEIQSSQMALGGVFIQASHAIAHASATKPVKEAMVFSQRRAMRRKRLI